MKSIQFLSGAVMCLALMGCGPSGPDLGTVKGKVTMFGRPLPNALVTFEPTDGGPVATGPTDEEGNYELFSAGRKGAKVGPHRIVITTIQPPQEADNSQEALARSSDDPAYMAQALGGPAQYKKAEEFKEKIPAKYNTNTELKEEVKSGSNEFNFDLK